MRDAHPQDLTISVRREGFSTVNDLLRRSQGMYYDEVATTHGLHAAPMQLAMLQVMEARESNHLKEAALDSLARFLLERSRMQLHGSSADYCRASAFAAWSSLLSDQGRDARVDDLTRRVRNLISDVAPPDWVPKDANDSILRESFRLAWDLT